MCSYDVLLNCYNLLICNTSPSCICSIVLNISLSNSCKYKLYLVPGGWHPVFVDFILPKPDTNSTVFDFLVIFCSFCVYSLVPGGWHQCRVTCLFQQLSLCNLQTFLSPFKTTCWDLNQVSTITMPIFFFQYDISIII